MVSKDSEYTNKRSLKTITTTNLDNMGGNFKFGNYYSGKGFDIESIEECIKYYTEVYSKAPADEKEDGLARVVYNEENV